jgi:hypothetical protein
MQWGDPRGNFLTAFFIVLGPAKLAMPPPAAIRRLVFGRLEQLPGMYFACGQ